MQGSLLSNRLRGQRTDLRRLSVAIDCCLGRTSTMPRLIIRSLPRAHISPQSQDSLAQICSLRDLAGDKNIGTFSKPMTTSIQ